MNLLLGVILSEDRPEQSRFESKDLLLSRVLGHPSHAFAHLLQTAYERPNLAFA